MNMQRLIYKLLRLTFSAIFLLSMEGRALACWDQPSNTLFHNCSDTGCSDCSSFLSSPYPLYCAPAATFSSGCEDKVLTNSYQYSDNITPGECDDNCECHTGTPIVNIGEANHYTVGVNCLNMAATSPPHRKQNGFRARNGNLSQFRSVAGSLFCEWRRWATRLRPLV